MWCHRRRIRVLDPRAVIKFFGLTRYGTAVIYIFLQGRFLFGPNVRSLALTLFLIVAPVAVFCVFEARKLMDNFFGDWGISVMGVAVVLFYVFVLLLLTSGRDPGIIPRNAHPSEPEEFDGGAEAGGGQTRQLRLPRIKEVEVNGITVKIKYCDTCMLYGPLFDLQQLCRAI
ncbi:hypothetical protein RJ641_009767 [Dillenia turbinata]|uniref:Uncharacterized protein n=1 Tax=Dillenia turbinata TaxID=194707 RepID=A0AAN8Z5D3_9MAGN